MPEKVYGSRKPVVFMFQPTEFQPVQPSKMREWAEQLKHVLGDSADSFHRMVKDSQARDDGGLVWLETTSICPGGGADDCDAIEHEPI